MHATQPTQRVAADGDEWGATQAYSIAPGGASEACASATLPTQILAVPDEESGAANEGGGTSGGAGGAAGGATSDATAGYSVALNETQATAVSCRLCTVTFHANHAHNLTRSP